MIYQLSRIKQASILVIFCCAASVIFVSFVGYHYRPHYRGNAAPVVAFLAKNTSDVYSLWKFQGTSGNILIHIGNYLHFVPVDRTWPTRPQALTVRSEENEKLELSISYKNYLWVATQAGLVRYIHNVLPPATYDLKIRRNADEKYLVSVEKNEIVDARQGILRRISHEIPETREPVLLNIDASYLSIVEISELAEALRRSGLSVRLLTLCLSEDNPDVTQKDRTKLKQLSQALITNHFISSITPVDQTGGALPQ